VSIACHGPQKPKSFFLSAFVDGSDHRNVTVVLNICAKIEVCMEGQGRRQLGRQREIIQIIYEKSEQGSKKQLVFVLGPIRMSSSSAELSSMTDDCGLRITNTRDSATLKKENDEYKRQLRRTSALLQQHGLDLDSAAPTTSKLESHHDSDEEEQATRSHDAYPSLSSRRVSFSLRNNGKEPCFDKDAAMGRRCSSGMDSTETEAEEEEEMRANESTEDSKEPECER